MAQQQEKQANWCEAKDAWAEVAKKASENDPHRVEALERLDVCKRNCNPPKAIDQFKVPKPVPIDPVPEDKLVEYYPGGKTVHSVSRLWINGEGTGTRFILKGTTNFFYQYQLVVETKVKENTGTTVVFEQYFKEVTQIRAESHHVLQLAPPDSPILAAVWSVVDKHILSKIPLYVAVKAVANVTDPDLRWTLTYLLPPSLNPSTNSGPLSAVVKIGDLQGTKLEIEYISGLGVTNVKVLGGKKLGADLLEQLAYRSSLLMDYVIGKEAEVDNGKPFEVPFKEVRGVCGLGYDIDGDGKLVLRKGLPSTFGGEKLDYLEVERGNVSLRAVIQGVQHSGEIEPTQGASGKNYVLYSADKRLVRRAMATWDANFNWFTEDSLLFGTHGLNNVHTTSYYEANVAK
jgi:hypothetical protein